jgi:predicted nucleic acid-binding protein
MSYVADTYALVGYLVGNLPAIVNKIFGDVEGGDSTAFVPTIVLAECLYLVENKKIELDFDELLSRMQKSRNFVPTSFNLQVLKLLPKIALPELHDRIIVATAKMLNAKLITKDKVIKESGLVETVW